jgi:ABC-2 type transport system ATP-binding protein
MAENNPSDLFQHRLREVANHYQQGDVSLGYRRLMDAALDTDNKSIFDRISEHTEWLENNSPSDAENWAKSTLLLEQISKAGLHTHKPMGETIVHAKGLTKTYRSGVFSLGPIDIELKRGALLGLVGENGNGKTTLLRILAQELKNDAGEIQYHLPQSNNQYDLRSQLAYIPQRTPKWQGSLKDNLKFTLSSYGVKGAENESKVLMIIARLGLWKYRNLDWSQLSSGYKMRFELARTFLRCPDILLLDEPLANLDVLAQQTILEDLKTMSNLLSAPMAVVLSSQQLYEVEKVSDRVLFLKNGQPIWQENTAYNQVTAVVEAEQNLIIEFDTDASREQLQEAFSSLSLEKMTYNGGSYIAYFNTGVAMPQVLAAMGAASISVMYIRNISKSTRRFFVH